MKKALLALAAALLLLIALLAVQSYRDKARQADGFVFDTAQKAGAVRLTVVWKADSLTLIRLSGNRWVTSTDSFPVDSAHIAKALSTLFSVQSREEVSGSADTGRLQEYGLDPVEAKRVEWTMASGNVTRFLLGKTSGADFASTYWKWEHGTAVYRTPGNFTWQISGRAVDWMDRAFFPRFPVTDVRFVETDWRDFAGGSHHYRLESAAGQTPRLVSPDTAPAGTRFAQEIFRQSNQFAVDEFIDPIRDTNAVTPARAGLDAPSTIVRIGLKDGRVFTVKAGSGFAGYVYAQHPSRPNLVKLFAWRLEYFRKRPEELVQAPPTKIP